MRKGRKEGRKEIKGKEVRKEKWKKGRKGREEEK